MRISVREDGDPLKPTFLISDPEHPEETIRNGSFSVIEDDTNQIVWQISASAGTEEAEPINILHYGGRPKGWDVLVEPGTLVTDRTYRAALCGGCICVVQAFKIHSGDSEPEIQMLNTGDDD